MFAQHVNSHVQTLDVCPVKAGPYNMEHIDNCQSVAVYHSLLPGSRDPFKRDTAYPGNLGIQGQSGWSGRPYLMIFSVPKRKTPLSNTSGITYVIMFRFIYLHHTFYKQNSIFPTELYAMPAYSQNVEMASFVTMSDNGTLSLGSIIGCVVAAFVMGKFFCLRSSLS